MMRPTMEAMRHPPTAMHRAVCHPPTRRPELSGLMHPKNPAHPACGRVFCCWPLPYLGSQPSSLACRLCTYSLSAVSVTAVVSG